MTGYAFTYVLSVPTSNVRTPERVRGTIAIPGPVCDGVASMVGWNPGVREESPNRLATPLALALACPATENVERDGWHLQPQVKDAGQRDRSPRP